MDRIKNLSGKVLAIAAIAIVAVTATIVGGASLINRNQPQQNAQTQVQGAAQEKSQVTIEVDNKKGDTSSYTVDFADGESVFDIMKRLDTETEDFIFEYKTASFGSYITSINGYAAASNEFWKFVVNGEDAQVGISDYKSNKKDNIKFVIEEITF